MRTPPGEAAKIAARALKKKGTNTSSNLNIAANKRKALPSAVRLANELTSRKNRTTGPAPATATQKPSKEEGKTGESRKRKAEESTGPENATKRVKIVPPKGLGNYHRACFANASLQSLCQIPELVDRYKPMAGATLSDAKKLRVGYPFLDRPGKSSREIRRQRAEVRALFQEKKDTM